MTNKTITYNSIILGRPFIDGYFKFWALVLPIASVLVFPSIQGTTPGYLMAFLSVPLMLVAARIKEIRHYLATAFWIALAYFVLNVISQFLLSVHGYIDLSTLPLVDPLSFSRKIILRPTLFTQTLYLSAGILTFLFVYEWYRPSWDTYIFAGALLLAAYGFYEFFYFWMTGRSGDFLSNRIFNDRHSGSLFQTIKFAGITIQRMKSLTGEPSMFAFTMLPYWLYALHCRRFIIGGILTLTLFLSTSTTAIIGIAVYACILILFKRINIKYLAGMAVAALAIIALKFHAVINILNRLILQKLGGQSISGNTRLTNLHDNFVFWWNAPSPFKLFGLGFGYIRSTDFLTTLLINNGLVGLIIMLLVFGYPVLALQPGEKEFGLRCALVVIAVTMLISVPEYAYLPVWLFLGISYNYLNHSYDDATQHLYRRSG